MAKLANSIPGGFNTEDDLKSGWDRKQWEKEDKTLNNLYAVSDNLKEGEIVGAMIDFPRGDGRAFYRVIAEKPLTLQWVPFGDRWSVEPALIRGLTRGDILGLLQRRRSMNAFFGKQKGV